VNWTLTDGDLAWLAFLEMPGTDEQTTRGHASLLPNA
jgi:hypothetical protein